MVCPSTINSPPTNNFFNNNFRLVYLLICYLQINKTRIMLASTGMLFWKYFSSNFQPPYVYCVSTSLSEFYKKFVVKTKRQKFTIIIFCCVVKLALWHSVDYKERLWLLVIDCWKSQLRYLSIVVTHLTIHLFTNLITEARIGNRCLC